MSKSTRQRILQQVRKLIDSGQCRCITFALARIAAHDHRRSIQSACVGLAANFAAGLQGAATLGEYMARRNLPLTVNHLTLARLAWIDRTLETLP